MTRPQRIQAMRDRLGEIGWASKRFRAALALSNDPAHQRYFKELLDRIDLIIANEARGATRELGGDLSKARQDLRRLQLPELDPDLEAPTPALTALRGERGNLIEALEHGIDAARALGLEPRMSEFGELQVPRATFGSIPVRLDERLGNVGENIRRLDEAAVEPVKPDTNITANRRGRLERVSQRPSGLRFRVEGEHFVSDATPEPTDMAAAFDDAVRQQHAVAKQRVAKLLALVRRQHNSLTPVWDDLLPAVTALAERLEGGTETLPRSMVGFYDEALAIGSLLEQQAELVARPEDGEKPLPADLRRVLGDAVGAVALLVRAFPSNVDRDRQFAMFWDRDAVTAARAVKAMAAGLLHASDAALLDAVERTAERDGVQGDKAKGSLIASIGNMALVAVTSLLLSGVANESPFIKKVSAFVVQIEEPIGRVLGSLPSDLGAAIRFGIELAKDLPDAVPPRAPGLEPPDDFDINEVHRLILAGEAPPAGWVPFITALKFNRDLLKNLSPLRGLSALKSLDAAAASINNLAPLTELGQLEVLQLTGGKDLDLRPLSSLTKLQQLNLVSSSLSGVEALASLKNLVFLRLGHTNVSNIEPLEKLTELRWLELSGTKLEDISPLKSLGALQTLDLGGTNVSNFSPLKYLTNLHSIYLYDTKIDALDPLIAASRLSFLELGRVTLSDFSALADLRMLRTLGLHATKISDLAPLINILTLHELDIASTDVTSLEPIAALEKMKILNINETKIENLDPISNWNNLEELSMSRSPARDLSPLSHLTKLHTLRLDGTAAVNLQPISSLHRLKSLDLRGSRASDFSPLSELQNLEVLRLHRRQLTYLQPLNHLNKLSVILASETLKAPFI